ncbi:MAG TPA: SBBP repeat-containing protein [Bryobacteraceae bacterium]|nr:SBBP repeat-containing protein [Bryobacteraceae bacterium]
MKLRLFVPLAGLLCGAGTTALFGAPPDVLKLLDTAPLRFEPAAGVSGGFVARGARYSFEFLNHQAVLHAAGRNTALRFDGAEPRARIQAEDPLQSKTNVFLGNDPSQWRQGVANYGRLRVPGLYPGVDLVYHGNARELEYDLKIAPAADPGRIRFHIAGAHASVDPAGNLVADLIQKRPIAYQTNAGGVRTAVQARYRRNHDGSYGFALGHYDRGRELVIDPVLTFSTYFSGSNQDIAYAIAHDQNGLIYVAGTTNSTDFPLAGAPTQATAGGSGDVWVAQIDPNVPAGQGFRFTTYVGGTSTETFGGLAVSPNGDIYLTGSTQSTDFPVTSGAYQSSLTNAPNTNAFVVWINSSQSLAYSSYLGGSSPDVAHGIAIDSHGSIWITGGAQSSDFPTVAAFQSSFVGDQDMFVAGFDPSQSGTNSLIYSSYLGGTNWDTGRGIAVAADGTLWIAGGTYSFDAPLANAYQPNYHTGGDAYIAHIDPTMGSSGLLYATFLGGGSLEEARNVVLDPAGPVIVSGYTVSSDFPITSNAYQQTYGGDTDGFIAILNPGNASNPSAQLLYSTYFGGANADVPFDLKRDSSGTLYLSGMTTSAGLPATPGALQPAYDGSLDVFVLRLNPAQAGAAGIDYFTYLGSDGLQVGYGVDYDSSGNVYVVGSTSGPIFDVLGGAGKTSTPGKTDAFMAGFSICGFSLSLGSQQFPASGATGTIAISAQAGDCSWTASSGLDWVTVAPGSGSGNGSVTITVAANTAAVPRQGSITIAGVSFLIGQDAASTPAASHFRR